MGKRYRAMQHGEAQRADVTRDVYVLDKLRDGLPDPTVEASYNINLIITPIASGTWLSPQVAKQLLERNRLPEGATITLLEEKVSDEAETPAAEPLVAEPTGEELPEADQLWRGQTAKVYTLRRKPIEITFSDGGVADADRDETG
jgi:hypothetical protein